VKFSFDQGVDVDPDAAVAAYANPAFFEGRASRDNISVLDVPRCEREGARVVIEVRFRFSGGVSSAVRAVVDPKKNDLDHAQRARPDGAPEHVDDPAR
jgi:hypothetical protein